MDILQFLRIYFVLLL